MSLTYDDLRTAYIAFWAEMITQADLERSIERQRAVSDEDPLHWTMAELLRRRRKIDDYQRAAIAGLAAKAPADAFLRLCVEKGVVALEETRPTDAEKAIEGPPRALAIANRLVLTGRISEAQAADVLKEMCEEPIREFIRAPRSLELLWQVGDLAPEEVMGSADDRPMSEKAPSLRGGRRRLWTGAGAMAVAALIIAAGLLMLKAGGARPAAPAEPTGPAPDDPNDLVRCLDDPNPELRAKALRKLVKQKATAVPALAYALISQSDPRTLRGVIHALGLLREKIAAPALAEQLHHRDWTVRYQAVDALGRIGGRIAYRAIAGVLQPPDPEPRVRALAAKVLKESGDSSFIDALRPLTRDSDPQVAKHARDAIRVLSGQGEGGARTKEEDP